MTFKKGYVPWNKGLRLADTQIKEISTKRKKTMLDRYGKSVWNKGLTKDDLRVKNSIAKTQATMLKKYGTIYPPNPEKHGCYKKGHLPWQNGLTKNTDKRLMNVSRLMTLRQTKQIVLTPSHGLGYFCGLIIGDGWLFKTSSHNYGVAIESTDSQLIEQFCEITHKVFPNLKLLLYTREKLRKFGQKEYKNRTQIAIVNSKMLYEALRPYKQKDFHWEIPKFLTTQESITGFLQGLYDAEGFIERHNKKYFHSIGLCSKHKSNLLQIQQILSNFGFDTKIYPHFSNSAWYLHIFSKEQALKFQNLVGFQLPRKKNLLEVIL